MKVLPTAVLAGLAAGLLVASDSAPDAVPAGETRAGDEIARLVGELADESFKVREKASAELWKIGYDALPALQEAAQSADPEQVIRARELIRKIELHITPETEPAVLGMLERYAKASLNDKLSLLARLREKRAWRQMLRLYAAESRPEARAKLQPAIKGVAVKAARERLYQHDAKGAREYLEMSTADTEGLLALADFHRSQGTLDAELRRARDRRDKAAVLWQLALHRAAGNLGDAQACAREAGELETAAAMAALAGDPLPWLTEMLDPQHVDEDDDIAATYAGLAAKRWQGRKIRPAELEPLNRRLTSRNPSERIGAMNALMLLGEVTAAEATLAKAAPLAAFRYFDALERVPEALKAIGLNPDDPDYKSWVEEKLRKLPATDIEDQHGPSDQVDQIIALANFLERRGLHDQALAAFAGPMAAVAEKDAEVFAELLGKFFGTRESLTGAPMLAANLAAAWAGDDDDRWNECVLAAYGNDEQTNGWWEWLGDLDPKATRPQRLAAMLALLGMGTDPGGLRKRWTDLAWAQVAATAADKREPLLVRMAVLSSLAGDVRSSLKAWDQLPDDKRNEVFWGEHILHLSAAERWDDAAKIFLDQIAQAKESRQEPNVQFHAYAAAALRQAGRHKEAAAQDRWIDQLVLGSSAVAVQAGNGYAFGRDYERAAQWWARAARLANPSLAEFAVAWSLHADVLMENAQWKELAAVAEVLCRSFAGADFRGASPLPLMHERLTADIARALAMPANKRDHAIAILDACHQQFISDGSLADFFFPAVRKAGFIKQHDQWFDATWQWMDEVIRRFPASDNSRNTAAWFAARAVRKLAEAEQHLKVALASDPHQSAYLDTMAEIHFAMGDRETALRWSREAVNYLPRDAQLRRQQERFRSAPLPQ